MREWFSQDEMGFFRIWGVMRTGDQLRPRLQTGISFSISQMSKNLSCCPQKLDWQGGGDFSINSRKESSPTFSSVWPLMSIL